MPQDWVFGCADVLVGIYHKIADYEKLLSRHREDVGVPSRSLVAGLFHL